MLLAIDVGNTNIVYGLFDGSRLVHQFRVETSRGRTADEYAVIVRQLLSMRNVEPAAVRGAIIASVVPSLTEPMIDLVRRGFGLDALVVGPGIKTGMSILYENPREVGADRIVNAVAAYERFHSGLIVVDFGTATTFDCVTPKGEYMGGVIAPGIQISADALFARAARLPRVEIQRPPKVVGRNTQHSMQSGIVFGYVGLVDGLVDRLVEEMGFPS
ncbi:MAG: Pantothenate kinase type CoaX-like, partial [Labilithrix sp.]|nr:Pantothenate kinase type CoaX-like [Labilithrix sp.]